VADETPAALKRKNWARWLKTQMRAREMIAADVVRASEGKITSSVITRWENETYLPDSDKVRAVADVFQLPVLTVLIAAGYLTSEEAGVDVVQAASADDFTDDELIESLRIRLQLAQAIRQGAVVLYEAPQSGGHSESSDETEATALQMQAARRRKRQPDTDKCDQQGRPR